MSMPSMRLPMRFSMLSRRLLMFTSWVAILTIALCQLVSLSSLAVEGMLMRSVCLLLKPPDRYRMHEGDTKIIIPCSLGTSRGTSPSCCRRGKYQPGNVLVS